MARCPAGFHEKAAAGSLPAAAEFFLNK